MRSRPTWSTARLIDAYDLAYAYSPTGMWTKVSVKYDALKAALDDMAKAVAARR